MTHLYKEEYTQLYIIHNHKNIEYIKNIRKLDRTLSKETDKYYLLATQNSNIKLKDEKYYRIKSGCSTNHIKTFTPVSQAYINNWCIEYDPVTNIPFTYYTIRVVKDVYKIDDSIEFVVEYNYKNDESSDKIPYMDFYFILQKHISCNSEKVKKTINTFLQTLL
jgi:hypothetical protein